MISFIVLYKLPIHSSLLCLEKTTKIVTFSLPFFLYIFSQTGKVWQSQEYDCSYSQWNKTGIFVQRYILECNIFNIIVCVSIEITTLQRFKESNCFFPSHSRCFFICRFNPYTHPYKPRPGTWTNINTSKIPRGGDMQVLWGKYSFLGLHKRMYIAELGRFIVRQRLNLAWIQKDTCYHYMHFSS